MEKLSLVELRDMSAGDRASALDRFVTSAAAPRNGQAKFLDAQIREYELRYELPSSKLRAAVSSGEMKDTAEVARWLILLDARDGR